MISNEILRVFSTKIKTLSKKLLFAKVSRVGSGEVFIADSKADNFHSIICPFSSLFLP